MLERDAVANNEPTPTFFLGIPSDILTSVCACVLSTTLQTAAATETISSVALRTTSVCHIHTLHYPRFNMRIGHSDFSPNFRPYYNHWGKYNSAEQRTLGTEKHNY